MFLASLTGETGKLESLASGFRKRCSKRPSQASVCWIRPSTWNEIVQTIRKNCLPQRVRWICSINSINHRGVANFRKNTGKYSLTSPNSLVATKDSPLAKFGPLGLPKIKDSLAPPNKRLVNCTCKQKPPPNSSEANLGKKGFSYMGQASQNLYYQHGLSFWWTAGCISSLSTIWKGDVCKRFPKTRIFTANHGILNSCQGREIHHVVQWHVQ